MNPEDLPWYIQPFTHLFNKKKFEKLQERQEWNHKINLIEDASKELNVKAYTIIIIINKALNQWLDKQLSNYGIKFKIYNTILLYPKERWIIMIGTRLQKVEPLHDKE